MWCLLYDANVQRKKLGWEPTLGTWQFRWSAVCCLLHIAPGGVEEYYYYCPPHIIAPGSRGVLRYTTSTSSHCTRRYYCFDYYYCLPHFAPSGVEKWFPRRRSTNQGLHLCSPALSHQAASKVGLSQCPSLGQQEGILLNCGLLVLGLVLQNCNCHCPGSTYRAVCHNRM